MDISVNGKPHKVSAPTLADLMVELGQTSPFVATALNGDFIPRESRAEHPIHDGDRVEILAPMKGG